ncbi:MAG: glycosyltransferase family 39 protein [Bacteroidetes bacterium]|nr:glycosyltransferase family 39 protein [Bacteroidota bacterium]
MIKLFYSIAGFNSYVLRLPSAIFTALTSVYLYNLIKKEINFNAAIWIFLLLLTNNYLNTEAQLVHNSTLVLFLFVVLIKLFNDLINYNKPVIGLIILINALLFYISNQTCIILLFEFVVFAVLNRQMLKKYLIILGGTLLTTNYFLFNYIYENKAFEKILTSGFMYDIFYPSYQAIFKSEFYFNLFFLIFSIITLNIYFKDKLIQKNKNQSVFISIVFIVSLCAFYVVYKTRFMTNTIEYSYLYLYVSILFSILIIPFFSFNKFTKATNLVFMFLFIILIFPSISLGSRHENRNKGLAKLIEHKTKTELIIIKNSYNFLIYSNQFYFLNPQYKLNLYLNNIVDFNFYSNNKSLALLNANTELTFINNKKFKSDEIQISNNYTLVEDYLLGIYHVKKFKRK